MQRSMRRILPLLTAAAVGLTATLPARAALVGTDEAAPSAVQSERERVKALVARPEVAKKLETLGVLPTDARYRASNDAVSRVDRVYQWAMCARVAAEPIAARCREQAAIAIDRWVTT